MRRPDLLVVGGGTAGLVAARTAAKAGARVLLVERERTGGDCLWTGCVPSKALIAAAAHAQAARDGARFGVHTGEPEIDFAAVMAHVHRARDRIAPVDSPAALETDGVAVRHGTAVFTAPDRAVIDGVPVAFRRAVVATGSRPAMPPVPGLADADPLTTDTVWDLTARPRSLLVLGAGANGCELAQAFARLGTAVTLVEGAERVLPGEEPAAGEALAAVLAREGVDVRTGSPVARVRPGTPLAHVDLDDGATVAAERLLVATGRRPGTAGLGLPAAGVRTSEHGHVEVDDRLRTSVRGVLAAGDVTGRLPFTHVAGVHGSVAATNAVLAPLRRVDHAAMPWVTFTDPEVAHVGLTEAAARHAFGDRVRCRILGHEHVDRAVAEDDTAGFTHVVLDPRGRAVGATVLARRGGEMLTELTALVARRGRLRDLAGITHPYPGWGDGPWKAALGEVTDTLSTPVARGLTRSGVAVSRVLTSASGGRPGRRRR